MKMVRIPTNVLRKQKLFLPNYIAADGKYYCYECRGNAAGAVATQKPEVGKDLSLELTGILMSPTVRRICRIAARVNEEKGNGIGEDSQAGIGIQRDLRKEAGIARREGDCGGAPAFFVCGRIRCGRRGGNVWSRRGNRL